MTPTVVGELVYVASCSGLIFAFDKDDGAVVWSYDTTAEDGAQTTFHGDPLVTDELLIVPGDNGLVYAFEQSSGELRWKTEVGPVAVVSDLVRVGANVAGVNRRTGVFALDLETGTQAWIFEPLGAARGTRAVSPVVVGDRFYLGGSDGVVYSLEAASGESVWSRDLETPLTTSLVLAGGQLIVGGSNGRLYRLDPATGEITAELELPVVPVGTPVHAGGALVLTDYSSFLLAVEADLGGLRWSQPGRWSTERVLPEGDAVIAGMAEGELAALRLVDGERSWSTRLKGHIRGLSKDGGTYYIGTVTGTVYAYRRPAESGSGDAIAATAASAPSDAGYGFEWIAGHWRGSKGESTIEEAWTGLDGDSMLGIFRLVSEGELQFAEFMSIELEEGAPVLRIKHFSKGLLGWEEKDEAVTFDLISTRSGETIWQERAGGSEARLTYRLTGPERLSIVLDKPESRSEFELQRLP